MSLSKKNLTASEISLNELIDFLEQHGNPVLGKRWRTDKEGLHTYMTQPLDIDLIKKNFTPDNSVRLSEEFGSIITAQEWMEICHRPGLQYNPKGEGYGNAYFYPEGYFDMKNLKNIYIDKYTGEILLGKANIEPGSSLADFPQLKGKKVAGFLSIPLPWKFSDMPWFAGIHETKKLFSTKITKIALAPNPYPENSKIEDAIREEEIAFTQQEFLKEQLGAPHECGAVVTHYKDNPIYVHYSYTYTWGTVSACWDPKNTMSGSIEVIYA